MDIVGEKIRGHLIEEFKNTLKIGGRYFNRGYSYEFNRGCLKNNWGHMPRIVWEYENTVEAILNTEGRVAALNFADGYDVGGLVWQGEITQEECLCRSSDLYLRLEKMKYPIDGKLIYSRDVVFFRDSNLKWLPHPKLCDIISCPCLVCSCDDKELKMRMRMIVDSAVQERVGTLILGKWGCGAFGNDWEYMKKLWCEVLNLNEL